MKTEARLPASWAARLVPLKAWACMNPTGGDWSYLLASGRTSWWVL